MEKLEKVFCRDCEYWYDEPLPNDAGECHYWPPQAGGNINLLSSFPRTLKDQFCYQGCNKKKTKKVING